jgi:hypothetical protein
VSQREAHQPEGARTWRERSDRSRLRRLGRRGQRSPSARRRPRAASRDPSRLPLQRCGAVACSADKHLKLLQDAGTRRWARSHSGGAERRKTIRTAALRHKAACRSCTKVRQSRGVHKHDPPANCGSSKRASFVHPRAARPPPLQMLNGGGRVAGAIERVVIRATCSRARGRCVLPKRRGRGRSSAGSRGS